MKLKNIFLTLICGLGLGAIPAIQGMESSKQGLIQRVKTSAEIRTEERERKRALLTEEQRTQLDQELKQIVFQYYKYCKEQSRCKMLINAFKPNLLGQIKQKLNEGANPNLYLLFKKDPLSEKMNVTKFLLLLELLIDYGFDVHSSSGQSLLRYAATHGLTNIIDLLIKHQADINEYADSINHILEHAISANRPACIQYLLAAKASPYFDIGMYANNPHNTFTRPCLETAIKLGCYPRIGLTVNDDNRLAAQNLFSLAHKISFKDPAMPTLMTYVNVSVLCDIIFEYAALTEAEKSHKITEKPNKDQELRKDYNNLTMRFALATASALPAPTINIDFTNEIFPIAAASIEPKNQPASHAPAYTGSSTSFSKAQNTQMKQDAVEQKEQPK